MKKILGLVVGVLMTAFTFAQSGVNFTDAGDGYDKTAAQSFHFNFDANYSIDDINKTAAYYTDYFTVEAVTNGGEGTTVVINLVDNEMGRKVITRFFVSLEVDTINAEGREIDLHDFIAEYIML